MASPSLSAGGDGKFLAIRVGFNKPQQQGEGGLHHFHMIESTQFMEMGIG
jgi:hypothetical protein